MHYLRNKQPLIFAPLNASSLLLLMGCVVIRNNSQTPIEFDAETASYTRDENTGFRAGEIVHTPTLQTSPLNAVFSMEVADPRLQNLLSIDPETGVVTATGDFTPDYDAGDREFEIVIIASNESQDARQTVTLRIKDINDSAPIFEPAPASANTVAENQTYSQSFKANPDAQEDGVSISYSLSGADASNFSIDPQTGVVTANAAMDYEASKKEFNFSIIATAIKTNPDGTTSELQYNNVNLPTARQDVTLAVTNVNDNAPVIDTSKTATSRPENTNISSSTVIYDAEGTYDVVPITMVTGFAEDEDAPIIKAQFETSAGKKYTSQLTFTFALNDGVTTVNFDSTNRYEVTDESLFDADSILTDYTMLQTIFGGADYFCMKDYDELQTSLDVI